MPVRSHNKHLIDWKLRFPLATWASDALNTTSEEKNNSDIRSDGSFSQTEVRQIMSGVQEIL